ncbi:MAG: hypothetical protein JNL74_03595 [Fibrobacteres bacterium]|nr:hypothetical protein [Fibrobacterota bacterium]
MVKIFCILVFGALIFAAESTIEQVDTTKSVVIEESIPAAEAAKESSTEVTAADLSPEKAFTPINRDTTKRAPDILPIMKSVRAHFSSGSFNSSLEAVNLALKLDDLDYEAIKYKGMIFLMLANLDSAETYLNLASTAEGKDSELDFYKGLLYGARKKYRKAQEMFDRHSEYTIIDPYRERMRKYAAFSTPKAASEWAAEKAGDEFTPSPTPNTAVWLPTIFQNGSNDLKPIVRAIDGLLEPSLAAKDSISFIEHSYVRALIKKLQGRDNEVASKCGAPLIMGAKLSFINGRYKLEGRKGECISETSTDSLNSCITLFLGCITATKASTINATTADIEELGRALILKDSEDYAASVKMLKALTQRSPKFTIAQDYLSEVTELLDVAEGRALPMADKPLREPEPPIRKIGLFSFSSSSKASKRALNAAVSDQRSPFLDATNSGSGGIPRRIIKTRIPVPEP